MPDPAALFDMRLVRSMKLDGRVVVRGTLLRVPVDHAHRLLVAGAAVLIDDEDLPRLIEALRINGRHAQGFAH
jgi:hypothetical protein